MKKATRIIAFLLVFATTLSFIPTAASAVEYGFNEDTGWTWPLDLSVCGILGKVTSGFGVVRTHIGDNKPHQGIDIGVSKGNNVYAARSGKVYDADYDSASMGNYVCIYHGTNSNGKHIFSTYMHLSEKKYTKDDIGKSVNAGEFIGKTGNTGGKSTGAHLHFHVFRWHTDDPRTPSPNRSASVYTQNYVNVQRTSMYTSTLNINVTSHPKLIKVGSGYGMRGSVTSNYKITQVNAAVYNKVSGNKVLSSVDYPNSNTMNIQYSNVNNQLIFNNLSAGQYRLEISATDASGRTTNWHGADFDVAIPLYSIDGARYPVKIKKGSTFGLRGTINSNFTITKVIGEIIRKSDGKTVDKTWDEPNSTRLNIQYANLNNNLEFNLLKPGKYTLKYTIYLSCGTVLPWTRDFEVTWW